MILFVGNNCQNCKMLEEKLKNANIKAPETLLAADRMDMCQAHNIRSVPALLLDSGNVVYEPEIISEFIAMDNDFQKGMHAANDCLISTLESLMEMCDFVINFSTDKLLSDGIKESKTKWAEVLEDCKARKKMYEKE